MKIKSIVGLIVGLLIAWTLLGAFDQVRLGEPLTLQGAMSGPTFITKYFGGGVSVRSPVQPNP
jgi:hypothetical protein